MKINHILLVEDNEGDIMLITDAIDDFEFKTTLSVVKNGKMALEYLFKIGQFEHSVNPDIIILDINLPLKNGLEVLQLIKSNDFIKTIPVVMFTTSSTKSDIMKSYANYANAFVTKPVEVLDFLETIKSIGKFWLQTAQLPNK